MLQQNNPDDYSWTQSEYRKWAMTYFLCFCFCFYFYFFSSSIFLNRAARVVNYVAVSAVSSLPRTICFAMSGTFCRFDMLCDLRKKAALSNFLRDILHFMFVFVFSLFTLILSLKTELCRFFPTHNKTKTNHTQRMHHHCTFLWYNFWWNILPAVEPAHFLAWEYKQMCFRFSFTTHWKLMFLNFLFFLVAGIWTCFVKLSSQLQFLVYRTVKCLLAWSCKWPLFLLLIVSEQHRADMNYTCSTS